MSAASAPLDLATAAPAMAIPLAPAPAVQRPRRPDQWHPAPRHETPAGPKRPTALDRVVAETDHPWRIILPAGPLVGNGLKAAAWMLPLPLLQKHYPYAGVVALSGLVAGPEYAASKTALVTAHLHEARVNEHLVATLMFATDNLWRTGVQCAVDKGGVTRWDWAAIGAMIGVAGLHGLASYRHAHAQAPGLPAPATAGTTPGPQTRQAVGNATLAAVLAAASIGLAFSGVLQHEGVALMNGVAYGLATVATVGKVVAWWMHIQPFIQRLRLNMPEQIALGWQTAFWTEYWALIGAITIGTHAGISLPLMFGYMIGLENIVRMAQFNAAGKPTQWFDYGAAAAMVACVIGQGVSHVFDASPTPA
jgi:hypothetical protein